MKKFFIVVLFSLVCGTIIIGIISFVVMRRNQPEKLRGSICCVAGKSGGHLIPALTLARQYHEEHPDASVLFFSTDTPLDKQIVKKAGFVNEYKPLSLGNVPRWDFWRWPRYLWDLGNVSWHVWRAFLKTCPEKIMTTGGFISLPVGIIAWALRIPVYLYELNVVPGKAAILLSRFAKKTFVCFDEAASKFPCRSVVEKGQYPLRFGVRDRISEKEARHTLGLANFERVILVIGGSQGSFFINTMMPEALASFVGLKRFIVLHQTGAGDVARVQQLYKDHGIAAVVFAFREDIAVLYSAADCVVSRAGAGSLFELLFFGKPAIIIPLETEVTDHQLDNARAMERKYPAQFSVFRQVDLECATDAFEQKLKSFLV